MSLIARDLSKNPTATVNLDKTIKSSYGYSKENYCYIFAKNFAEKLYKEHGVPSRIVTFGFAAWPIAGHVYVTYVIDGQRWAIDNEMAAPRKVKGATPADWTSQLQDVPKKNLIIDVIVDVPPKSEEESKYIREYYRYMLDDLEPSLNGLRGHYESLGS